MRCRQLLLTFCLCVSTTTPALSVPARWSEAPSESMVAILEEHRDNGPRARRLLLELGVDRGVPEIFAILAGRVSFEPHEDGPLFTSEANELLHEALRTWPRDEVVAKIASEVRSRSQVGMRMLAVRLIGEVGNADSVSTLFDLYSGLEPAVRCHAVSKREMETALADTLTRDAQGYRKLARLLPELDASYAIISARALGLSGAGAALPILEQLLGTSPAVDLVVLEALGSLRPWDRECADGACGMLAGDFLRAKNAKVRRQAVLTLGRLQDTAFVLELIELLGDPDRRVAKSCRWSLQEITGCDWGDDVARWHQWYTAESRWMQERSGLAVAEAHSRKGDQVFQALREISTHSLFRRELASAVSNLVDHQDPNVAAVTCDALARLRATGAVDALARGLDHMDANVRDAALRALSTLTGEQRSADQWRTELAP